MKRIELADATGSLAQYAQQIGDDAVIVTLKGKPVAALVSLESVDWETITLSTNFEFMSLIEKSRARRETEGGISGDEMRRRLGPNGD